VSHIVLTSEVPVANLHRDSHHVPIGGSAGSLT